FACHAVDGRGVAKVPGKVREHRIDNILFCVGRCGMVHVDDTLFSHALFPCLLREYVRLSSDYSFVILKMRAAFLGRIGSYSIQLPRERWIWGTFLRLRSKFTIVNAIYYVTIVIT